ncbi:sensor histidine kinase [Kribbella solani]|uniref:sensor histidine kinase n=1 Tax=Kribbella solani TaxID=236067 RepID=UPI0029B640DC|nr:sensor histidine kinase [Kribbella solani]MDX2968482.1 sensor histidine kinase [Kribbella solani]
MSVRRLPELLAAVRRQATGLRVDAVVAVLGLMFSQFVLWQGWGSPPHGPGALLMLVLAAPALIAFRRIDPVIAAVGMAAGASAAWMLSQTDLVLFVGCAMALWSLPTRCSWRAAAATITATTVVPFVVASLFDDSATTWRWLWIPLLVIGVARLAYQLISRRRVAYTAKQRFAELRSLATGRTHRIEFDVVVAGAITALTLVDLMHRRYDFPVAEWEAPKWMIYFCAYAALSLVLRRSWPVVPVLVLTVASLLTYWQAGPRWFVLAAFALALCSLIAHRVTWPRMLLIGVVLTVLPVVAALIRYGQMVWIFPGLRHVELENDNGILHNRIYEGIVDSQWPWWLSVSLAVPVVVYVLRWWWLAKSAQIVAWLRNPVVLDCLLALAGVLVLHAKIFHPNDDWSTTAAWLRTAVVLSPLLIAFRRVVPLAATIGLLFAAVMTQAMGGVEWFLLAGCALALWTLVSRRALVVALPSLAGVVIALPWLVNQLWRPLVRLAHPTIWRDDATFSPPGRPDQTFTGTIYGIHIEDLERIQAHHWSWRYSAALLVVGLAALAYRLIRRRVSMPVRSLQEWLGDLRTAAVWKHGHLLDLLLAVAVTTVVLLDIRAGQHRMHWWAAQGWTIYVLAYASMSLVFRRVQPIIPTVVLAGAGLVAYLADGQNVLLIVALGIALYSLVVRTRPALGLSISGVILVLLPAIPALLPGWIRILAWLFPAALERQYDGLYLNDYGPEFTRLAERSWPIYMSLVLLLPVCGGLLTRLYQRSRQSSAREAELERLTVEQGEVQVVLTERSHIARDLHDVVAHAVNLMVIQAETGPDLVQRGEADVLAGFQRIGDAGRRALGELDRMLSALRDEDGIPDPALAPQPGLADLRRLAGDVSSESMTVSLDLQGDPDLPPDGHQLAAYRLVQEALTNAVRHAEATKAMVTVEIKEAGIQVRIADDGRGFEPEVAQAGGRHGLAGMRERVRIHEGKLTITSAPGEGTEISAWLPISRKAVPAG